MDTIRKMINRAKEYIYNKTVCSPTYIRAKSNFFARLKGYNANPDPVRKLEVSVDEINYYRSRGYSSEKEYWNKGGYWTVDNKFKFDKWSDLGAIYSGKWDLNTLEIEKLPKYVGMKEHFVHGVPWNQTSLFDFYQDLIREGITVDGCKSMSDLMKRYRKIEKMCESIRSEGYKSREEICSSNNFRCLMDEVTVSIGRNGQFIFGDGGGWHRLCAAKIFDIETIPVRVLVRHSQWQKVRERIYDMDSSEKLDERLKKYADHPDLTDILS